MKVNQLRVSRLIFTEEDQLRGAENLNTFTGGTSTNQLSAGAGQETGFTVCVCVRQCVCVVQFNTSSLGLLAPGGYNHRSQTAGNTNTFSTITSRPLSERVSDTCWSLKKGHLKIYHHLFWPQRVIFSPTWAFDLATERHRFSPVSH